MNALAQIKMSNLYDSIVSELPSDEVTEGTTVLNGTDGKSWEFLDGAWKQIDLSTDFIINNSLYLFLMSVCDSIKNDFTTYAYSVFYENVKFAEVEEHADQLSITGLLTAPIVRAKDYIVVKTQLGAYLTKVLATDSTTITFDKTGLDIRITGDDEVIGVFLVSFPPQFLNSALSMLGYDLFLRDSKEKRQERLGNYTYTNFEPQAYYGKGAYPSNLEDSVKYWEHISI